MYFLFGRISRDGWQARVLIEHERSCECGVDIIFRKTLCCSILAFKRKEGTNVRMGEERCGDIGPRALVNMCEERPTR